MTRMIVDVHTHIFPPSLIADRAHLASIDAGFGELYASPKAGMATAEHLLASMDAAGVDVSVACGFWWQHGAQAAEHRAYLLDAAAQSDGRIVPFVPIASDEDASVLDAAVAQGARGLGEWRGGGELDDASAEFVRRATALGLPVLAHCSEDVGHLYPGKHGGLTPGGLWRLISTQPEARVIAAHWGGGFPFAGLMPEVRAALEAGHVLFDTAATPLLYEPRVFIAARMLLGDAIVAWGSDFPLREQERDRAQVEAAGAGFAETYRDAILGGNAARFLELS
ncbi:MAG: amidohydrolase [Chloroflexi bacterium]|nr:MAG: amidohydrolase [Chloroflexota bacterium]